MTEIRKTNDSGQPKEISPREKTLYKQEYVHGADLFQRALQQHAKSANMYQKAEFQEVMENMMQVMNETARALKEEVLKKQNEKISEDFKTYQQAPSESTQKRLAEDLDQAKKLPH